jgi:hypothetical protein
MTDLNIESLSQEFCELTEIESEPYWWCPHCLTEKFPHQVTYYEKCTVCNSAVEWIDSPDFTDPREVLKVMMKRGDWPLFRQRIGMWGSAWPIGKKIKSTTVIDVDLILDYTGLLLKEAVEFLRGVKS